MTDASDSPHLGIPNLRARVPADYAGNDRSMTPDAAAIVDRMPEEAVAEWHFTRLREWLQG